jgi:hypothetical protein
MNTDSYQIQLNPILSDNVRMSVQTKPIINRIMGSGMQFGAEFRRIPKGKS